MMQEVWRYASAEFAKRHPASPQPFLTQTTRSKETQEKALREGKSRAKFGQSAHNYSPSFAFDIAFKDKNGKLDWTYRLFEMFWKIVEEKYKGTVTWGGNFKSLKDGPHFEDASWKRR